MRRKGPSIPSLVRAVLHRRAKPVIKARFNWANCCPSSTPTTMRSHTRQLLRTKPLDHVSVEAGFMSFLRFRQAFAITNDSEAEATVAAEAANRFPEEHLSNIAEPLSYALHHSGEPYLALAGKALLCRVGPARKQIFDVLDQ